MAEKEEIKEVSKEEKKATKEAPKLSSEDQEIWEECYYKPWMGVIMCEPEKDPTTETGKARHAKFNLYEMGMVNGEPKPIAGYEFDHNDPTDKELTDFISKMLEVLSKAVPAWFFKKEKAGGNYKKFTKEADKTNKK